MKKEYVKKKKSLMEWGRALLWAVVITWFIRLILVEPYRIPTPSMENSLAVGDFLLVAKPTYGIRTPMVLGIPLTDWTLPFIELPWVRFPGFRNPEKGDIVVFNYPLDPYPIATKRSYVKRCVAVAGDVIRIENKQVYVNDKPTDESPNIIESYIVKLNRNVDLQRRFEYMGVSARRIEQQAYLVNLSKKQIPEIEVLESVDTVEPHIIDANINTYTPRFTFSSYKGNHHHMAELTVPYKGQVINLDQETWHFYKDIVTRYENHTAEIKDEGFYVDGKKTTTYTIEQDYYFMMGDNRNNSEDSRFWGFVPDDHIVGKPILVFFSWPKIGRLFTVPS